MNKIKQYSNILTGKIVNKMDYDALSVGSVREINCCYCASQMLLRKNSDIIFQEHDEVKVSSGRNKLTISCLANINRAYLRE